MITLKMTVSDTHVAPTVYPIPQTTTDDSNAVFPSRPSIDGRARLDGQLWKIARLTPVYLRFCPSICDYGHAQSVIKPFGKQVNNTLKVY